MKHLVFTVTNDLVYDQRMIRICSSLSRAGYTVTLVGRCYGNSPSLLQRPFGQKRLRCRFRTGFLFYAEYTMRLFFYLMVHRFQVVCAIDLDTIIPCYLVSRIRNKKRVYDAHELFCEMKEVVSRPHVYRFWKFVERHTVPQFKNGYTVNQPIRDIFFQQYKVSYRVIRNLPVLDDASLSPGSGNYVLYQGAVNEGRCFESLIPAFCQVPAPLWIYGDGNFYTQAVALVAQYKLQDKILFQGKLPPEALREATRHAAIGITLFENRGLNNYLSLANRFFDYIHAGVPQVCVNYPAYRAVNSEFEVAVLIDDLSPQGIAAAINGLLDDRAAYQRLQQNCRKARQQLCWQQEENELCAFYASLF